MTTFEESSEHIEQELKTGPVWRSAMGSLLLHGSLVAAIICWGLIGGFFHHNTWGSAGGPGAIQVTMVSNALPLPSDQPVNQNVLATETPSQDPEPPAPKAKEQAIDDKAIPILGKQKTPDKQQNTKHVAAKQMPQQPQNRAQYGEQAGSSMPRTMQSGNGSNSTQAAGDFGSRFGWYVEGITRKMDQNWYRQEVDPGTPRGTRTYIVFIIARNGTLSGIRLDRSSGSPTLDRSCMRAAQRVDSFGPLPAQYAGSSVNVSHYCEY